MDVKTALHNGHLDECIYMVQPDSFIVKSQEHKVCKLLKSIYGLKQISRNCNIRFDHALKLFRFDQNLDEPSVYKKANKNVVVFLVLYVAISYSLGMSRGIISS